MSDITTSPIPGQPLNVVVVLDKSRTICFNAVAEYRMGQLDRPFGLSDLFNPVKSWSALVGWIWACLVPADAKDFPGPEQLAPLLKDEAKALKAFAALLETWQAQVAPSEDDPKNVAGSKTGRLPASS